MTNRPMTPEEAERERRQQATADTHGGVEVLDADRPHLPGEPDSTHQTTADPYRPNPDVATTHANTGNPRGLGQPAVDAANRPGDPQGAYATAPGRTNWSTIITAIAVVLVVILLLSWLF